ncbi:MAG: HNH endonuclease, partial [Deltaproteobacteria bacterium]|nr:HNH endonuclease [Deltaproteobacteria bacterium]
IHTEIETLKEDGSGAEAEIEDRGHVPAETCRRLACDCARVHWHENQHGEPLNVGRKSRTIPPAIRRALKRRDQGCRFPGCTCSRFVDAHHIQHWADGGETSMDNLVLLCRVHHRLVHEGGFHVRFEAGRGAVFSMPDGRTIPQAPETRSRGNVFALMSGNRLNGLKITPGTSIPAWHGEIMDNSTAVDMLLQCE